jgi:hypothetical protein
MVFFSPCFKLLLILETECERHSVVECCQSPAQHHQINFLIRHGHNLRHLHSWLLFCTQTALGNMAELSQNVNDSYIVFRQSAAGLYPAWAYVVAAALASVPLLLAECAILGVIVYFMSNCFYEAGTFFTFYAILFTQSLNVALFFRFVSAGSADEPAAHSIAGPVVGLWMILGGFFVNFASMPVWYVKISLI